MRGWTIALVAALVVSVAVNATAVGTFLAMRARRSHRFPTAMLRGSDPEARRQMRELMRGLGNEMDSLRKELDREQHELTSLLRRPEASEAEVESVIGNIALLHSRMTRTAYDNLKQMLVKLPAEQQESLLRRFERQYKCPMRPHRGDRDGRRGRGDRDRRDASPCPGSTATDDDR